MRKLLETTINRFNQIITHCQETRDELLRLEKKSISDICFIDKKISQIRDKISKNKIDSFTSETASNQYHTLKRNYHQLKNWDWDRNFSICDSSEEAETIFKDANLNMLKIAQNSMDNVHKQIQNLIKQQLKITNLVEYQLIKVTTIAQKKIDAAKKKLEKIEIEGNENLTNVVHSPILTNEMTEFALQTLSKFSKL